MDGLLFRRKFHTISVTIFSLQPTVTNFHFKNIYYKNGDCEDYTSLDKDNRGTKDYTGGSTLHFVASLTDLSLRKNIMFETTTRFKSTGQTVTVELKRIHYKFPNVYCETNCGATIKVKAGVRACGWLFQWMLTYTEGSKVRKVIGVAISYAELGLSKSCKLLDYRIIRQTSLFDSEPVIQVFSREE